MAGLLAVVVGILAVIISASASSPPPDFNGRPRGVAKSSKTRSGMLNFLPCTFETDPLCSRPVCP